MALLSLKNIHLAYGGPSLLEGLEFNLQPGERVCLMGRNGVGKTSLLRVMAGEAAPDSGEVMLKNHHRVGYLPQEVPTGLGGRVFDIVARGLGRAGEAICKLREGHPMTECSLSQGGIRQALEDDRAWQLVRDIEDILGKLRLDPCQEMETLSGGFKRKVLLARALASNPDILLLDEPTNHLDIEAIVWLEEYLAAKVDTLLFISHDRAFARRLASRVVELDRGRLMDYACGYDTFLKRRQETQATEEMQREKFAKKMAQEEEWLVQGLKARRTRNEGRVRALMEMRDQWSSLRQRQGNARLVVQDAKISGKIVIKADDIDFSYGDNRVIEGFSTTILRGDKLGLIGPDGSGKTTLLNLLMARLNPSRGAITHGTNLEVAYSDQLRGQLDEEATVRQNISPDSDTIVFQGRQRHVMSYLKDFLFSSERANTPVKVLSGGERNRLLLAKLFTNPANLLVFDEPTNDLDAETLELLEYLLVEFEGTVILVSHDRQFINNVVTSTMVMEGNGQVGEYAGGYDDWLLQKKSKEEATAEVAKPAKARAKPDRKKKLGFNEKRELEALPGRIEALEKELAEVQAKLEDPQFYIEHSEEVKATSARQETIEGELEEILIRWEELEALAD